MIIGHGGNIKGLAETLGCSADDIIDMSCNLNPLGPPQEIEKVIKDNLFKIRSLPEPDAGTLKKGFAQFQGIDQAGVAAGNGTTWFIYTIPKALESKKVVISSPTYSDYMDACVMHNKELQHCVARKEDLFKPDIDRLSDMAGKADTVFLCNPNNPTGALVSKEKLLYLIKKHEKTVFVIDESYLPFVDDAEEISLVSCTDCKNLIVLSSMSKIFTIPGLRTGFLSADPQIVEKIMTYYQPWSINVLAQVAGEYIFNYSEKIEPFYLKTRRYLKEQKKLFFETLKNVKGLQLFNSNTCFILARLSDEMTSKDFCTKIGFYKILIRDCSNFFGLSDNYVRFSLKDNKSNMHLADAIYQVLNNA